jgi:hypothetical protein
MNADATRLVTVEARWFGDGALPTPLAAWFQHGGEVRLEPTRTDRYLRLAGVEGVGVKWRAGRFQIKARLRGAAAQVVWQRTPAPLETWLKWSVTLEPPGENPLPPVDVAKTRRLITRPGVQIELAEVAVADRLFWTFGLEGERAGDLETVLASEWIADAGDAAVAFAGGYPAWLDRYAAG